MFRLEKHEEGEAIPLATPFYAVKLRGGVRTRE